MRSKAAPGSLPQAQIVASANRRTPLLDNIKTLPELVLRLQSYFLSVSYGQPPAASPSATGGRTIAITNRTQAAQRPMDTTVLQLNTGTLTWDFATTFIHPPVVTGLPVGVHGGTSPGLYIDSVTANGVVINSTDNTDNRTVHLQATGNPY